MVTWWTVAVALAGDPRLAPAGDGAFQARFEAADGQARVVALMARACRTCPRGATALAEVLAAHPDVVGIVVWAPAGPRDRRPRRRHRAVVPGAVHLWDPDHTVSDAIVAATGADGQVWDVILSYGPDRRWPADGSFPVPDWWGAPVVNAAGPLGEALASPADPADGADR